MQNKKNVFSRVLIVSLIVFTLSIIVINFIFSSTKFTITKEIIMCLVLVGVLCLSENFDNLSIPKVLSLSKNIKSVREENEKLRENNIKLVQHIFNNSNSNTLINNIPGTINTVSSSNIEDVNSEVLEKDEVTEEDKNVYKDREERNKKIIEASKYKKHLNVYLLKKVLDDEEGDISYEVKVSNYRPNDDIMKNEARFDALRTYNNTSTFYEVKMHAFMVSLYQLHYQLNFVKLYNEANKTSGKLILVFPKFDDDFNEIIHSYPRYKESIKNQFEPAIKSGLLEILDVPISKKEMDKYIEEKNLR